MTILKRLENCFFPSSDILTIHNLRKQTRKCVTKIQRIMIHFKSTIHITWSSILLLVTVAF